MLDHEKSRLSVNGRGAEGVGYEINRQSLLRNPSFLLTVPITTLTASLLKVDQKTFKSALYQVRISPTLL